MPARWTTQEERKKRAELVELYVRQNKTIGEVAAMLKIGESTAYGRLIRLGIPSLRPQKPHYNNRRLDITIPSAYSGELAEFVGILLGDGGIKPTQITITIDSREIQYIQHIAHLAKKLFHVEPRVMQEKNWNAACIYFGSTEAVRYFINMGLVYNKVYQQVTIPKWIFSDREYQRACIRGLIDTDGSIYKLRFGTQMSFTNRSKPLLLGAHRLLLNLGYHPSAISHFAFYLTRRMDLIKYAQEIGFANQKHRKRFLAFMKHAGVAKPGQTRHAVDVLA